MHESFERLLEISNGLSQEVIARRIDESPQTLTNWKKRGVSKAGALKAAAEFGCSANWILSFLNGVCRHELPNAVNASAFAFLNGVCRHEHLSS